MEEHSLFSKTMFRIIRPIHGYGYVVGTETSHIRPEDAELFLKHGLIEKLISEKPAPEAPAKAKKVQAKKS